MENYIPTNLMVIHFSIYLGISDYYNIMLVKQM